uniref:Uncharacterized protein n=1 Tax=viral metagenome TaxID=1070528 RepID=A0A6C0JZ95_9ZZZZ
MKVLHPFEAFYESMMLEARPKMPKSLEDAERMELQSTTDRPVTVKALCGELQATLVADGTFTLEYDNVLHVDLNSFELLWYLKQLAFQQKNPGVIRLLQPTIACDPQFALQHIFLDSKTSLKEYVEYKDMPGLIAVDEYADMPPLIPAVDEYADMPPLISIHPTNTVPIRTILDRLLAKQRLLKDELANLKKAIQLQEDNRALEVTIQELQSKLL